LVSSVAIFKGIWSFCPHSVQTSTRYVEAPQTQTHQDTPGQAGREQGREEKIVVVFSITSRD
jgi:hypothetical protein